MTITQPLEKQLEAGIAAWAKEQKRFIRLLKKRGSFTEHEFDKWFRDREFRRPIRFVALNRDSFILGWNYWSTMLSLLQMMGHLGIVEATLKNGVVVYSLSKEHRNDHH